VVMGLDNPIHIVFLVVILLLVFGAKRLPEIGRSLGGGMREFKDSVSGNHPDQQQSTLTPAAQQPQAPVAQQAPLAQPAPVQAPPVAVPPAPSQVAPAPAPVEPQHQA
jgi:sec-independent protein translocase protein TatA